VYFRLLNKAELQGDGKARTGRSKSGPGHGSPPPSNVAPKSKFPARFRGMWKLAGSRIPGRDTIELDVLLEVEVKATLKTDVGF
jgi:hypothetical protein